MDGHLERLLSGLSTGDGMAKKRARETLVLVGDPAVPGLQALLASSDKSAQWEAAKALGAVIDPGSLDAFVTAPGRPKLRPTVARGKRPDRARASLRQADPSVAHRSIGPARTPRDEPPRPRRAREGERSARGRREACGGDAWAERPRRYRCHGGSGAERSRSSDRPVT